MSKEKAEFARDIDLVRKILLYLERQGPTGKRIAEFFKAEGYGEKITNHHLDIMKDANLVSWTTEDEDFGSYTLKMSSPVRLTWEGHEFLAAIRDDERWERVKAEIGKGGGFVYEIVKSIALDFLEEDISPNRERSLQVQLTRRWDNLNRLEEQAANYPAAQVPIEFTNKIDEEKKAIDEIERKLQLLS